MDPFEDYAGFRSYVEKEMKIQASVGWTISDGRIRINMDHKLTDLEAQTVHSIFSQTLGWPALSKLHAFFQNTGDRGLWNYTFALNKTGFQQFLNHAWELTPGPAISITNGEKFRLVPGKQAEEYVLERLEKAQKSFPMGFDALYAERIQVIAGRCLMCGSHHGWSSSVIGQKNNNRRPFSPAPLRAALLLPTPPARPDKRVPSGAMQFWFDLDPENFNNPSFMEWVDSFSGSRGKPEFGVLTGICDRCMYHCKRCKQEQPRLLNYARYLEWHADSYLCAQCIGLSLVRVKPPKLERGLVKSRLKGGTVWM